MCNYLCCFLLGCCCLVALEEEDAFRRSQQRGIDMTTNNPNTKIFLVSVEKNDNEEAAKDKNSPVSIENSS